MNTNKATLNRDYSRGWETFVLQFGKFKGKTLLWLAENEPNYLIYLAANTANGEPWQAKLDAAVDYMLDQRSNP